MWFLAATAGAAEGPFTTHYPGHEDLVILVMTWCAMALIILVALMARSGFKEVPSGLAGMFEHIYDWVLGLSNSMMGPVGKNYVPLVMTIFLLVLVSNWMGLLPGFGAITAKPEGPPKFELVMSMQPHAEEKLEATGASIGETRAEAKAEPISLLEAPTSNINTTLSLAIVTFIAFTLFGLQAHFHKVQGGGHHHDDHGDGREHSSHPSEQRDPVSSVLFGFVSWLAHFIQPAPMLWNTMEGAMKYLLVPPMLVLFIVLNLIEEGARLISLTLRLFGNIAGEHQVKVGLFIVVGVFSSLAMSNLHASVVGATSYGLLSVVVWGIGVFVTLIGALAGFVQAMVFMLLTISYVSHAVVLDH